MFSLSEIQDARPRNEVNRSWLMEGKALSFHLHFIVSSCLAVSSCCLPFSPLTPLSHMNHFICKKWLDFCWFSQLIWLDQCAWGVLEAAQGMNAGLVLECWVGWEKVLGVMVWMRETHTTGKHQGFNSGSIVYRSVPTTLWSPGIQQLTGNPHSAKLQEGLWVTRPRTVYASSPRCSLRVDTVFSWGEKGYLLWHNCVCFPNRDYGGKGPLENDLL